MKFISEIRTLGSNSLISLLRQFKLYDDNNTKELELYESTKALHEFETELSEKEILSIFNQLKLMKLKYNLLQKMIIRKKN